MLKIPEVGEKSSGLRTICLLLVGDGVAGGDDGDPDGTGGKENFFAFGILKDGAGLGRRFGPGSVDGHTVCKH